MLYLERKPIAFHVAPLCWSNWNLDMTVLVEGRKHEKPEKNQSKERTNSKLNPYMALAAIKPGPHWWQASTLTTATSLLLQRLLYELVYGNLIILNELQYLEISLSWVSCCYLSWLNWNLECWFLWREKKP